jgi:hypothetical protein
MVRTFNFVCVLGLFGAATLFPPVAHASTITLESASNIAGAPGDVIGWGVEITSPTYWLLVDSVQSTYASYPLGLSADATPVTDYLSVFSLLNGLIVDPGGTFSQDFRAGDPGTTGQGLGAFHIRPDAAPGATESGDILVSYALFNGNPYTCGNDCFQVDANGNPSSSDLVDTLASRVSVTQPATVPEPGGLFLPLTGIALILLSSRKRRPVD